MSHPPRTIVWAAVLTALLNTVLAGQRGTSDSPQVEELTIAQIHSALKAGRLTCRGLVDAYLRRIDAYDKQGPAINAIVVINRAAREEAATLDRRFSNGGLVGHSTACPRS